MLKIFRTALIVLAAGAMLAGSLYAQTAQAPPAKTPSSTTAKKPATAKPGTAAKPAPAVTLKTQQEKFSYALGMNLGANLHKQSVPIDPAMVSRGLKDGFSGAKTLLTEEEAKAALTEEQNVLRKAQQEKMQAAGDANKKQGAEFLAANKSKEGVVALPSGLQYKILKAGDGPKPSASDTVVCNYRGTLLNGTEFDSSYKRGQPATFPLTGIIRGWTEALQLMPVGSKWQLFVPADLAYGEHSPGPEITPNSTLIFEVELLSIQPKAAATPAAQPAGAPSGTAPAATAPAPSTPAPATAPPDVKK